MRKLLSVTLIAALTAVTTGCECWDCFHQFEAWKNQTLFGCCSANTGCCSPNTGCCPTYGAGVQYAAPQYAAPQYAAPLATPIASCAGMPTDCGGFGGVVVQSPYTGGCPGGLCAPAPQGVIMPGQTVIAPGQVGVPGQVIMPGTSVSPGPETYAPTM